MAAGLGVAAAVVLTGVFSLSGSDNFTPADTSAREVAFNEAISKGVNLAMVPAAHVPQAVANMKLDSTAQKALLSEISSGRASLAYVRLWDDLAEDGDTVRVTSGGYSVTVSLTKAGTQITVPLAGTPITITGESDGGGGITAGIGTNTGSLFTPVLGVGQTITIPVF